MESIRKIVRKHLFEVFDNNSTESPLNAGEYSTEDMEYALLKMADLIPFGSQNFGDGPNITIPSNWPSSVKSYTKEAVIQNWNKAKAYYNNEPNTKWYIWKADVGGSFTQPEKLAPQRYSLDYILMLSVKLPESFRSMSIGVSNNKTQNLEKGISTSGD